MFILKLNRAPSNGYKLFYVSGRLESDVGFGNLCGFQTLAVLTGTATRTLIATQNDNKLVPNYILPSFADFVAVCEDLTI